MKMIYHQSIQSFLDEYKEILLKKEAVNQLILFNANTMLVGEPVEGSFYGSVYNNYGELTFVFLHMPPYNLLISSIMDASLELIDFFASEIAKTYPNIRGINAKKEVAYQFSSQFQKHKICEIETHFTLDIMVLTKLKSCLLPKGTFRQATESDIPLIIEWNIAFFEYIGETMAVLEDYIKKITLRVNEGKYYLFVNEKGCVVSMAAASRYLTYGVAIGPVFTPANERNKGYGMAVVYHVCDKLLHDGHQYVTLYVDQKNPISNHVYERIGFEVIEDQYDMRFIHPTLD